MSFYINGGEATVCPGPILQWWMHYLQIHQSSTPRNKTPVLAVAPHLDYLFPGSFQKSHHCSFQTLVLGTKTSPCVIFFYLRKWVCVEIGGRDNSPEITGRFGVSHIYFRKVGRVVSIVQGLTVTQMLSSYLSWSLSDKTGDSFSELRWDNF